jgi:hypothetical protein
LPNRSGGEGDNCIELTHAGMVRDSKNPTGPTLTVDLAGLLAAVRAGSLDR